MAGFTSMFINIVIIGAILGVMVGLSLTWLKDNHPRAWLVAYSATVTVVIGVVVSSIALELYYRGIFR